MAKKPDTPCSGGCGKLLWSGRTSLPAGRRKCRDCRRAAVNSVAGQTCGRCKQLLPIALFSPSVQRSSSAWCKPCHVEYTRARYCASAGWDPRRRPCSDCGGATPRRATAYGRLCAECAEARRRTRNSRKVSKRRTAQRFTDITAAFERQLRKQAQCCPLCATRLTDAPHHPNSKNLDHIVPICMGGTHTMGNVRIICRTCNLTRPKDGSDVTEDQLEQWARDVQCVDEIKARIRASIETRAASKTCRCGRPMVKQSCPDCPIRLEAQGRRSQLGRDAARLRAEGLKWREISQALRLSGTGTAYQLAWQYGAPEVRAQWPRDRRWITAEAA
jgi:hypothetical protein